MYLERLVVGDWRGYQHADIALSEHGLLVVAGANNSGKTALFSALDVVAGLETTPGMLRRGSGGRATVSAEFRTSAADFETVAAKHPDRQSLKELNAFARLELTWRDVNNERMALVFARTWIGSRSIQILSAEFDDQYGNGAAQVLNWDWIFQVAAADIVGFDEIPWGNQQGRVADFEDSGQLRGFGDVLTNWRSRFLHFASLRIGTQPRRPLGSSPDLLPSGENLPEALLNLRTNQEGAWERLQALMRQVLPEIGDLAVRTTPSDVLIAFVDATGAEFNLKDLGTGVEQVLLAAYAGIAQPAEGLIVIEEPEGSLHPSAQRQLLGHLRDWATGRAIVISTHSSILLDQPAGDVRVVVRSAGVSSITPQAAESSTALSELGVRLSDVLSSERLLLVEGLSDQEIIDVWYGRQLERSRAALLVTNGSDATWQFPTVEAAFSAADQLGRKMLVLRDRDELPEVTLEQLRAKPAMFVLSRREIENFLLDPNAIAAVLAERLTGSSPSADAIQSALEEHADQLRDSLVLRRTVARFSVIRLFDRKWVKSVLGRPTLSTVEARIEEALPDAADVLMNVRAAWHEETDWLAARWDTDRLFLAPGAELLEALWRTHGLTYNKRKDGIRLAEALGTPPSEIDEAIAILLSDYTTESGIVRDSKMRTA